MFHKQKQQQVSILQESGIFKKNKSDFNNKNSIQLNKKLFYKSCNLITKLWEFLLKIHNFSKCDLVDFEILWHKQSLYNKVATLPYSQFYNKHSGQI